MSRLVLLRHGQSEWNKADQFTGWTDVDLTEQGVLEARRAGQYLREAGFVFDIAFTSLLKRAIRTLWIALEQMDQMWLPVVKTWQLNERHYGSLQGFNKSKMADRFGKEQVFRWRRGYDVRPPALEHADPRHPRFDMRYAEVDPAKLPVTESLEDTLQRVLGYWEAVVVPQLQSHQRVLVVAHGNSLRALLKHLDNIPDHKIPGLNIPTGIPIVYDVDDDMRPVNRAYLGDADVIEAARKAADQAGKVKGSED